MLSIIVPFVGEYPQVLFTIQSVAQQLLGKVDFEIIAIDNWCQQAEKQAEHAVNQQMSRLAGPFQAALDNFELPDRQLLYNAHRAIPALYENRSGPAIKACAKGNPWLKYIQYEDRLSHWQAKRVGVDASEGDVLLFLDAHVITGGNAFDLPPSQFHNQGLEGMYNTYIGWSQEEEKQYMDFTTFHLPLTYKILEWHKLIYKFVIQNEYFYTYSFTGMPPESPTAPFEVPVMSTCGMMISRKIYDSIGGWPKGLGIYGGGENFMNFTLAVCGYKKHIYPKAVCYHHGDKRDYHYEGDDFIRNRMIAHYLFGGLGLLNKFTRIAKGRPQVLEDLATEAFQDHVQQRELIQKIQKYNIEDWSNNWDPIRS